MGLLIESANREYSYGYSGLHQIRHLAYLVCGGEGDFGSFMGIQRGDQYDDAALMTFVRFRSLFWHSDCEGEYTMDGSIDWDELLTGNSKELLEELSTLRRLLDGKDIYKNETDGARTLLDRLYEVVRDAVENDDGHIEFS